MKQIKVSEATEPVLGWLVAKAQGDAPVFRPHGNSKGATIYRSLGLQHAGIDFRPSTNWAQGGPIIERERIAIQFGPLWVAIHHKHLGHPSYGPTPLIAAMRCYVTSKLGETAEVPEELT